MVYSVSPLPEMPEIISRCNESEVGEIEGPKSYYSFKGTNQTGKNIDLLTRLRSIYSKGVIKSKTTLKHKSTPQKLKV